MTINENGLYDKYGLINSIIVDLNRLTVSGVDNMTIVLDSVHKLSALKEGLQREDKDRENNQNEQG